jgi:hypothetical protein
MLYLALELGETGEGGLVLEEKEKEKQNEFEKLSPGISTSNFLHDFTLALQLVSLSYLERKNPDVPPRQPCKTKKTL